MRGIGDGKVTPKKGWEATFIKWLSRKGNVTAACDKAKISRQHAYRTRNADPDFAAAWDEALAEATERLEMEALRRARDGVLEPVFYKGDKIGSVRRYSDTLLIFLLKAHAPDKYRENSRVEHSGRIEFADAIDAEQRLASRIDSIVARLGTDDGDSQPGADEGGAGET